MCRRNTWTSPKIGRIDAKNAPSDQPTPGPGADTDATMYAIIRKASIFFQSIENKSTYQAYPVYVYYGNSDGPQPSAMYVSVCMIVYVNFISMV